MTRLFSSSSSLALPLALAIALTAGAIAAFIPQAHAAGAQAPTNIRCFIGAKADTNSGANGGWVCVPEQRSNEAHSS